MRFVNEVVELDRDCEVGARGERAVVTSLEGPYMTLVFPNRAARRAVQTGADYGFVKRVEEHRD